MPVNKPDTKTKKTKQKVEKASPVIGIDLGTIWDAAMDRPEIIANKMGNRTTPSWVAFAGNERLIGEAAKNEAASNPENTIFDVKRLIGRKFSDKEVQDDMKHWPFKVVENRQGKPVVEVEYEERTCQFDPEAISAMILSDMKATAEAYLGRPVSQAVITVPAYFNDSQRQATKDAGQIAGLEVLRIVNEPTAAALAYGLQKKHNTNEEKHVLVYDLGGGTFDVSLLKVVKGFFTVEATAGNTHLGGDDFDKCLVQYCQDWFEQKHKKDISNNKRAITRLLSACEAAKRALSASDTAQTTIYIDSLCDGIDFNLSIRAAKFQELCAPLFNATLKLVEKVLDDARLDKAKVDEVVLVGGSTRIPKIREIVSEFFGGMSLNVSINPDEAVACGAAAQGAILSGSESTAIAEMLLVDVTPLSLGIAIEGQAGKSGNDGRLMRTLIPRNTTIPYSKTQIFTTHVDNQKEVQIEVYQGERKLVKYNHYLGNFRLEDLPKAKAGKLKIEVTYAVDHNGILTVSARESSSAKAKSVTITSDSLRLSSSQIEKMIAEAERFREKDLAQLAQQRAMADLESYLASMKGKFRGEISKKISASDHRTAMDAIYEAEAWVEENAKCEAEDCERHQQELENVLEPILRAAVESDSYASDDDADGEDAESSAHDSADEAD